jgi:UDP-N-acetylglucosamine 4-epimerase
MATKYEELCALLPKSPRSWLVTGGAGFIGSHLVETLLRMGQRVTLLDNFATGHRANVEQVLASLPPVSVDRLRLLEGDIRDRAACAKACEGVELVLHQAALGSVPRSIKDPVGSHDSNVTGFLHMLCAARDAGVKRFVYASSSSVYGDHPGLPKVEEVTGNLLSPYAATKYANELYAAMFQRVYGTETIGLRYFNVFGPRQDPNGPYAAVMPQWFAGLLTGAKVCIYGDGETSRDFCYVANVVQANLLAAACSDPAATGGVFNVACGERTTLNELFHLIRDEVSRIVPAARESTPELRPFREGDIRHSLADISKAARLLGYTPSHGVAEGLRETAPRYARELEARS